MKTLVGFSIEYDTIERFKRLVGKGNVSATVEQMMEARLNANNPTQELELEVTRRKLEDAEKVLRETGAEAAILKEQLDAAEQARKDAELAALEAEQARLKVEGSCVQCHQSLGLKPVTVRSGHMCSACFRSLPAHLVKDLV